jgi:hypothetical protein
LKHVQEINQISTLGIGRSVFEGAELKGRDSDSKDEILAHGELIGFIVSQTQNNF